MRYGGVKGEVGLDRAIKVFVRVCVEVSFAHQRGLACVSWTPHPAATSSPPSPPLSLLYRSSAPPPSLLHPKP